MATFANVNKDARGAPLKFFSRYFDVHSEGVNVFSQHLQSLEGLFCFPPDPVIFMVLRLLHAQRKSCVILVPAINPSPLVNFLKEHTQATFLVAKPYDNRTFTITHPTGKKVPKLYSQAGYPKRPYV
jgi:hypothetical protein